MIKLDLEEKLRRRRQRDRERYRKDPQKKMEYVKGWHLTPFGKYARYRRRAKELGVAFELSYDEFYLFWQRPCSYCGSEIRTVGLDRMNNLKGYELSNITSCCPTCNYMKKRMGRDEFLAHISRIVAYSS